MRHTDALLLGRRTYVTHAEAFEPMPPGDPFGDMMNAPRKYVVSRTLEKPIWRDTTIILVYPLMLGSGKRVLPGGVHTTFSLKSVTPYPTGVVSLDYERRRG